MTPARSAFIAMLALMLIATLPVAGAEEQYPRGLMSVEPTASDKKGCTIEVRPINFGTYDPLETAGLDAVGQVIYTCGVKDDRTNDKKQIRIEMSRGASNSYTDRRMSTGVGAHLYYQIYLDPTHRTIWGDGTNGTDVYIDPKPPNKTPVTVPAFARVRPMQDVPEGQYADVIQVTIIF